MSDMTPTTPAPKMPEQMLLPCPFCGGRMVIERDESPDWHNNCRVTHMDDAQECVGRNHWCDLGPEIVARQWNALAALTTKATP